MGSISRQSLPPPCSPTSQNVDINATEEEEESVGLGWVGGCCVVGLGGGWDESSFITRYWIQRRICCTRLHPFYWAGHHDLFPHTHCWRLLVKGKSPCANLELNRSSVSFNFSASTNWLVLIEIPDCCDSDPGAVCPNERDAQGPAVQSGMVREADEGIMQTQ